MPSQVIQLNAEFAPCLTHIVSRAGRSPHGRELFRRHHISYEAAIKPKSDLYRELLPLINSGRCELLDHQRLISQLSGLERGTARSGRDSIDHGPGAHDDVANAAAGALLDAFNVQKRRALFGSRRAARARARGKPRRADAPVAT